MSASPPKTRPTQWRLREVVLLALPITLGNVSQTLVSLVDTLMVGQLGEVPLAGLGAATILFLILFLVFSSLVQGVQVLCARKLGEGALAETGNVLHNALGLGLTVGLAAATMGFVLPEQVMPAFMGGESTTLAPAEALRFGGDSAASIAAGYLHWRWGFGLPLVVLLFVFKGFYWGVGISRLDLSVGLVANLFNVLMNWLLIFGNLGFPRLGAPGAGLASTLSAALALSIYALVAMRREFRGEYGTFRSMHLDLGMMGRILRLSIPRAIQGLAFGASAVFFMIIGNEVGEEGLAVSTVIWRFFGILVLVGVGIGTAASTLVGRELGAGRPDEANAYAWTAVRLGTVATAAAGLLCFAFPRQILGLFNLDASTVEAGVPVFRMMVLLQIMDAAGIILSKALVGAGQVFFVMFAEILVSWAVCIPFALLFLEIFRDTNPLFGAWCGWAGYILAWFLLMLFRWRRGSWRTTRV